MPQHGDDDRGGALASLPEAMIGTITELRRLPVLEERRSNCRDCSMSEHHYSGAGAQWSFDSRVRCCAHHPEVANFLVGRALERGGTSAELISRRLADTTGVNEWGIIPSKSYEEAERAFFTRFGRDVVLRCPFWVGGDHACGVWHDRDAVCRTFFCRHEHGDLSRRRWRTLRNTLRAAESALALRCIQAGDPPEVATPTEWEAWFRWCAQHARALERNVLADDRVLVSTRVELDERLLEEPSELPEEIVANVPELIVKDGVAAVTGYSPYDIVEADSVVLDFFAALDGRRSWRDALASTGASDRIGPELVRELYRIGALKASPRRWTTPDELPSVLMVSMSLPEPIEGGGFLIRSADCSLHVEVPATIFLFISALDGERPWRDALAEANREHDAEISQDIVAQLVFIGALISPDETS